MLSDFMSRWIYTGTEWSWIYSRPLATSRAICNLVDNVIGSFSANSIQINETSLKIDTFNVFIISPELCRCWLKFPFSMYSYTRNRNPSTQYPIKYTYMDITEDRYRLQNYCYIREYSINNKVTEKN